MVEINPIMHLALDNDKEFAAEVASLFSCYALIELFMIVAFEKLSGSTLDESEIIMGNISGFVSKIDVLTKLAKQSADEKLDKTRALEILNQLKRANTIRNKYAHSVYSQISAEGGPRFRISSWLGDARRNNKFENISLEQLKEESNYLRSTLNDMYFFDWLTIPNPE